MEELPLGVKIIGIALCLGAVFLLATQDRLIKMLRRSPNRPKPNNQKEHLPWGDRRE